MGAVSRVDRDRIETATGWCVTLRQLKGRRYFLIFTFSRSRRESVRLWQATYTRTTWRKAYGRGARCVRCALVLDPRSMLKVPERP